MVSGRVGSHLREGLSFRLDEVPLMSALGSCGCAVFFAIDLHGHEGWSVSLLICVGKAMNISSLSNASVWTYITPRMFRHPHFNTACGSMNSQISVGVTEYLIQHVVHSLSSHIMESNPLGPLPRGVSLSPASARKAALLVDLKLPGQHRVHEELESNAPLIFSTFPGSNFSPTQASPSIFWA